MIVETAPWVLLENIQPGESFEVVQDGATRVYLMTDGSHELSNRVVVRLDTGHSEFFTVGSSFIKRPYKAVPA